MGYKHSKEEILKVGYDVLRKSGYHNVGINQVLKEAGIPKGSFYNFFESKEDFARQVIKSYGESNLKWISEVFRDSSENPLETIRSFYKLMIDINEEDNFQSGCIVNALGIEVGRLSDKVAEESVEQYDNWVGEIAMVVELGQKTGQITKNYTSIEIAEYLHNGVYGTFFKMKVTRSRKQMDQWLEMTIDFIRA